MRRDSSAASGVLRIIGGHFRGRKLSFHSAEGLRPTGDRIRETLFNWLQPAIDRARCLDMFAGSGALGLEALSRGASYCLFLESASRAAGDIRAHLASLGATGGQLCHGNALEEIAALAPQERFDIVFVDPPFGQDLLTPACAALAGKLNPGAMIYVESERREEAPRVSPQWALLKEKFAGEVCYRLYRYTAPVAPRR